MCGGAGADLNAVCICASGCGVYAGEEPDHARPYGPAVPSAAAGWKPFQTSVL